MALPFDRQYEHLLRRAGFGARSDELATFRRQSIRGAVSLLLNYESIPDDVDQKIGQPGYVGLTRRGDFLPGSVIGDARQRWLFRMVHTNRPLQEKMTLFWHNHFATAYTKIAGVFGGDEATRYLAAKPSEDPGRRARADRDAARQRARQLPRPARRIAQDVAMLIWLDGRTNVKARPQENFGREIMELFTMGVGHFTEPDVYAAARVFTGWNLARPGAAADRSQRYEFAYVAGQHDTTREDLQLPHLRRRRQDDSGARRGRGDAGRARPHRRACRQSARRPRYLGDQAVPLLRLRDGQHPRHVARADRRGVLRRAATT